nr:hypothetical protein [Tanacetum cinerariifolium]
MAAGSRDRPPILAPGRYPQWRSRSSAPSPKRLIPSRSHTTTRHKGKEIAKPITPLSETASEEDSDPEQAQRDKDMQKNLALIAKYFKKIYKPTNNNLRTSSNSKNKNVDTTLQFKNDNQKPKRVKDSAYHKEKMLLYKQAKQGVPLQAEQYDWLADTDEEVDEQELEAHYRYIDKIQEVPTADSGTDFEPVEQVQNETRYNVFANHLQHSEQFESVSNTCLVETDDSNVTPDLPDMCEDDIQNEQSDVESNDEQRKAILVETSKSLGESISVRDSCLVAVQTKQAEFEKFKAFNDRIVDYEKLKRKLNEALGQLAQKDTVIREGLKTKAYELLVVKEKHDELMKHSLLTKSHYEGLVKHKMKTCLMPLAIKTQNDSFKFVHELKQEMHADLKYVESLEKEIDELESDKVKFSDMYDVILQECVSKDVMCSYLQSLSDLDALAELQCMYLHKVKECDCLAQKLSKQTESVSKKVHIELLQCSAKVEKHLISLELPLQKCKEQVKNESVCNEKASNVFRKEREQYFKIQDLRAQLQDKNIAISELKKLIEKGKGKSADTKFDRPSVVRQPNAQQILKPSVLGKPTPFSDSLERKYFPKTMSVSKTNVSEGLSKPVTAQTLTQTAKKAISNTNVLKPGMYRIDNRTTYTGAPQLPQTVRNTNLHVSTPTRVNHKPTVSKSQLKSNQSRDKVLPNNSQVKVKKTQVEVHPRIPSVSNKMKSVTATRKPKSQAKKSIATPNKKKVASKSTNQKPQSYFRVLYENTNKAWKWWTERQSPSGYKWVPKPKKQWVSKAKMQWVPKAENDQVPKRIVQLIIFIVDSGCTKHITGNLKLLCNFVEKFLGSVRFGNDQKSTCFVRDLQGNDLLVGNRGSDLYTISLQESTSSTPLCLMAKATPTQAWLWHRRLSHLNFNYINLLSKKDIVIGLPKLKYVKD